jgi:predicted chitinase
MLTTTIAKEQYSEQEAAFFLTQFLSFTDNGRFIQEPWDIQVHPHQNLYLASVFGNNTSSDMQLYKSRGFGRLTGKAFYFKFSKWVGLDCVNDPKLLLTPYVSYASWEWLWQQRRGQHCSRLATKDFAKGDTLFNGHSAKQLSRGLLFTHILTQVTAHYDTFA